MSDSPKKADPICTAQQFDDVTQRLNLVNRFNFAAGQPNAMVSALQKQFVFGDLTSDEMVSFRRLYQYLIHTAENPIDEHSSSDD